MSKEGQPRPEVKEISELTFLQNLFEKKNQIIDILNKLDMNADNYVKMVQMIEAELESLNVTRDLISEGKETHYFKYYFDGESLNYRAIRKPKLGF